MDLLSALPISLRQLQYIVAVAELGSFRRAAEACHVAQPSLSAQVAVAERMLGVQLFERTARRVRVPPPAAPLVAQARRILVAAGDLQELARHRADPFRRRGSALRPSLTRIAETIRKALANSKFLLLNS